MAQITLRSHRPSRWLMTLGVLSAVTLVTVGLGDFGDPMGAAISRERQRETVEAERIGLAWQRLLESPGAPAPPLGLEVTLGPDDWTPDGPGRLGGPAEPTGSSKVAGILLDSALSAAAMGDLAAAHEFARAVLERAPADPRSGEARLHLARWAAAIGDLEGVEAARAPLLQQTLGLAPPPENRPALGSIDGTSVALLAALIEPVDGGWAYRLLTADAPALPAPVDRVDLRGPELAVAWDPWWHELGGRLRAAAPGLDWDHAMKRNARASRAIAAWLAAPLPLEEGRWTLHRRGGALLAARETSAGTRIFATSQEGLTETLRQGLSARDRSDDPSGGPFVLRFDHEPEPEGVSLAGPQWLGNTSIGFSLYRQDPLATGRADVFRLRVVRGALLLLALAVLGAFTVAARTLLRAKRLANLRSTFVASVSHDLRTPIQSILLMAETLERGRVAAEASRTRYFATIRHEAQRLRRFVEDLLDGARIDRGEGARVAPETVETEPYFDEMERSMTERAQRDGAKLTFVREAMPAELEFDPDGVHRAAWNLFENALRHGKRERQAPDVTVEAAMDGEMLRMIVHDNGPGIPASLTKTVFEPFERAQSGPGKDGIQGDTGTGLGLAIVRAITRASGGDVQLVPSTMGARFVITFQAVRGHQDESA